MKTNIIYDAWTKRAVRSKVREIHPDLKGKALEKACRLAEGSIPIESMDTEVHEAIEAVLDGRFTPQPEV